MFTIPSTVALAAKIAVSYLSPKTVGIAVLCFVIAVGGVLGYHYVSKLQTELNQVTQELSTETVLKKSAQSSLEKVQADLKDQAAKAAELEAQLQHVTDAWNEQTKSLANLHTDWNFINVAPDAKGTSVQNKSPQGVSIDFVNRLNNINFGVNRMLEQPK